MTLTNLKISQVPLVVKKKLKKQRHLELLEATKAQDPVFCQVLSTQRDIKFTLTREQLESRCVKPITQRDLKHF